MLRALGEKAFFKVRDTDLVWKGILNREAIQKFQEHPSRLTEKQREIAERFKRDGYAITNIQELLSETDKDLFSEIQARFETKMGNATTSRNKVNVKNALTGAETLKLDLKDPFVKLALQETILDIISEYLGMWPILQDITVNQTVVIPDELDPKVAHNAFWHRDSHDLKIPKAFLYVSDVDEDCGPFFFLRGSQRGGPLEKLYGQMRPKGNQPELDGIKVDLPQSEIIQMLGKAGTVIFADVAGLHKGGHSKGKERRTVTLCYYTTGQSHNVKRYELPADMTSLDERRLFLLKNHK